MKDKAQLSSHGVAKNAELACDTGVHLSQTPRTCCHEQACVPLHERYHVPGTVCVHLYVIVKEQYVLTGGTRRSTPTDEAARTHTHTYARMTRTHTHTHTHTHVDARTNTSVHTLFSRMLVLGLVRYAPCAVYMLTYCMLTCESSVSKSDWARTQVRGRFCLPLCVRWPSAAVPRVRGHPRCLSRIRTRLLQLRGRHSAASSPSS